MAGKKRPASKKGGEEKGFALLQALSVLTVKMKPQDIKIPAGWTGEKTPFSGG